MGESAHLSATYVFDNDHTASAAHHHAIGDLLDGFSAERVTALLDLHGARCLEVGAGGGTFARWLAGRVGNGGAVVATDLNPRHLQRHPRVEVVRHDIVTDPPLGRFDLVHARLLLNHLPERRAVLDRLVGHLKVGGVLLTEDFVAEEPDEFVAAAPTPADREALVRFERTHVQVLRDHGNDRRWARQALGAMLEAGLADVANVVHGTSWRGGGAGARLLTANLTQLRDELGLPDADVDRVTALLADRRVVLHGYRLYSTAGRLPRPHAGAPC